MDLFSQATRFARRFGLGMTASVLLIAAVACTENPPPPPPPTGQPNQVTDFVTFFNDFQRTNTDPTKRPWFCHALGSGEHQHHSEGVPQGPPGPVPPEYQGLQRGNLSWEDCRQLATNLENAQNWALRYPTRSRVPAGCFQTVQYLPGMGNHMQCSTPATFNPNQPNTLQYDGDGPNARLIGMSWIYRGPENNPPDGFPGTNDVWHPHRALCRPTGGLNSGGTVIGNNLPDSQCIALGGRNQRLDLLGGPLWMVHAWIVPGWQYQTDVNAGMHPCLLTTGAAPASHPCWAQAQHDHTGGTPHDEHAH
jgi:hypothetical protein